MGELKIIIKNINKCKQKQRLSQFLLTAAAIALNQNQFTVETFSRKTYLYYNRNKVYYSPITSIAHVSSQ